MQRPASRAATLLLLTHTNHVQPKVAPNATLEDDRLIEISREGKIVWEWVASDHVDEFHFDEERAQGHFIGAQWQWARGSFDWAHLNSATYVGPNHWYDEGDKRFAPDNIIISSREASFLAIVARDGSIVWQLGPDFSVSPELRAIHQIIGQHHAHIIPEGLPGAGKSDGVRQRRSQRLWEPESHRVEGNGDLCEGHIARARNQSGHSPTGLVVHARRRSLRPTSAVRNGFRTGIR